jgi:predicted rRNA methylase YqxC with S4 and FtsJ domains
VRDSSVDPAVCELFASTYGEPNGSSVELFDESPIQGPAGNREFLLYARHGKA